MPEMQKTLWYFGFGDVGILPEASQAEEVEEPSLANGAGDIRDAGSSLSQKTLRRAQQPTHHIFAWRSPSDREEPVGYSPWGHTGSDTAEMT